MRFIDLFAGLGGFHVGLSAVGHKCVLACENNEHLAKLYEKNFGIPVFRDIRDLKPKDIPHYDILCAGFPCQPFSKAGKQKGLKDLKNGDFLDQVVRILRATNPKFFILENVPNLRKHDKERTWIKIHKKLTKCGYDVKDDFLSPHQFGVPQIRKRLFIVGAKKSLSYFEFPKKYSDKNLSVFSVLDKNPGNVRKLNQAQLDCLNLWQEIIDRIPIKESLPSFPIWGMEFGANYPFEDKSPYSLKAAELGKYRGLFGKSLNGLSKDEQLKLLPSYARTPKNEFPDWKKEFIRKNRLFFSKYHHLISPLMRRLEKYPPSWQKFEWNCLNGERNIKKYIIQFRASGIRVKRTNFFPALVLTTTQRPIIGWEDRYITPKEAARLQSLERIKLPESENMASRYLGNAVNAKIVKLIAQNLIF
jgi:DNA (cytosine-5)-methyltransferase 1